MASSSSSAAVAGQDLYDFDAPQFYDFGGETEERENDPPPAVVAGGVAAAAASMDNKQPQSQQQQQPDAGTVASLVKGMGSMSLPSPAVPGTIPSSEPQQQQEEQAPKVS